MKHEASEIMKIVIGIQARENSTRFPKKIYEPFGYSTVLETVIKTCQNINPFPQMIESQVVVLCSKEDIVKSSIGTLDIDCPVEDVVKRYYDGAFELSADAIIRVTADCPLIPSKIIEETMVGLTEHDYISNCIHRTFPDGYDCQGITFDGLEWMNEVQTGDREHPFLWLDECSLARKKFNEEGFSIHELMNSEEMIENPYHPARKLSIDTPEDLERCRKVYEERMAREK